MVPAGDPTLAWVRAVTPSHGSAQGTSEKVAWSFISFPEVAAWLSRSQGQPQGLGWVRAHRQPPGLGPGGPGREQLRGARCGRCCSQGRVPWPGVGAGTPEPTESQCKNLESCSPATEQPGDGCTEAMGMLMIMMD